MGFSVKSVQHWGQTGGLDNTGTGVTVNNNEKATVLAGEIAHALSLRPNGGGVKGTDGAAYWAVVASRLTEEPHIANAVSIELAQLLQASALPKGKKQALPKDENAWAAYWSAQLKANPHALEVLSALVMEDEAEATGDTQQKKGRRFRRKQATEAAGSRHGWLRRKGAVIWMNVLILLPAAVVFFTVWGGGGGAREASRAELSVAILKLFAVWVLSFVPSWLYVRFLGQRAGALWSEFVVNLHRLGWDEPRYLPKPPKASEFYDEWLHQGGNLQDPRRNLYRQKFNAYYGRTVSTADLGTDFAVTVETLFPVFLSTVVLSTSWVVVLYDPDFASSPEGVWDILKFGFLGAYAFTVQSLIRRFFQSDLRPSAYAAVILRLVVVFTTLLALYQVMGFLEPEVQAAVAFVVGGFPLVGIYALHRTAAVALRAAVPQITPPYPLSQIDGLNVWYEARLLEEGIEDMENLATANLVDVILHTRVPVGRLVDWVDQAHLYLHLDRMEVTRAERRHAYSASESSLPQTSGGVELSASLGPHSRAGTQTRTTLRQFGIRTATDLLKTFPPRLIDDYHDEDASPRFAHLAPRALDMEQIRILVRVLDEETGLAPIWNWQTRGVEAKATWRRPRSATLHSAGR